MKNNWMKRKKFFPWSLRWKNPINLEQCFLSHIHIDVYRKGWIRVVACMQILASKSNKNVSWNYPISFLFSLSHPTFFLHLIVIIDVVRDCKFNMEEVFFLCERSECKGCGLWRIFWIKRELRIFRNWTYAKQISDLSAFY